MLKKYNFSRVPIVSLLLIQSIIYIVFFVLLYLVFRKPIFSLISLLPIIIISWSRGRRIGCAAALINSFLTIVTIHLFDHDKYSFIGLEPIVGLFVQMLFAITTGTYRSMAKKLQLENTERKNAEKQLKKYQNQLEELVQKRTEQLQATNDRLRQIEKMEVVGQLAGGIAHDFNNQLSIVLGYCELLAQHLADKPQLLDYLHQIQCSGKRAADLTKQLLAFARKSVYKMHVVDTHEIINEITALLSHSLHKNITIEKELNATTAKIWGGANQIQNAILNLALNARDAMPNGGTLKFTTSSIIIDEEFIKKHELHIHPGNYVTIKIADTGSGMDSEVLRHLFEPFFTTKEEGKGTGMGLAAAYGIVNSHKGKIDVESKPGAGSTFTIYLPETSNLQESETQNLIMLNKNRKLHVLVIDDEKMVAQTVKDIISTPNITATLAFCGNEAVQIYKDHWRRIDIVIIDMMMPDMDGRQTFLALKEINPDIKAIISSGFTLNQEIDLALKAGASAFLQKPYNRHEIFHHFETILCKTNKND